MEQLNGLSSECSMSTCLFNVPFRVNFLPQREQLNGISSMSTEFSWLMGTLSSERSFAKICESVTNVVEPFETSSFVGSSAIELFKGSAKFCSLHGKNTPDLILQCFRKSTLGFNLNQAPFTPDILSLSKTIGLLLKHFFHSYLSLICVNISLLINESQYIVIGFEKWNAKRHQQKGHK